MMVYVCVYIYIPVYTPKIPLNLHEVPLVQPIS